METTTEKAHRILSELLAEIGTKALLQGVHDVLEMSAHGEGDGEERTAQFALEALDALVDDIGKFEAEFGW